MKSIISNANIIKSVYVPKYLYALSTVLSSFVTFLFSIIILVAVMIATNVPFTIYLIFASLPIFIIITSYNRNWAYIGNHYSIFQRCGTFIWSCSYHADVCISSVLSRINHTTPIPIYISNKPSICHNIVYKNCCP